MKIHESFSWRAPYPTDKKTIMKNTIYAILILCLSNAATAQTIKRNYMIGANIMTSSVNIQNNNTGYNASLQPKLGYFLNENLVIGMAVELGVDVVNANTTMNYGATPFARIFVGKDNFQDIPRRVMFFVEGGAGFGGRNSRFKNADGTKTNVTTNGGILYVNPGIDIFLNKNVALEVGGEYRHIGGTPQVNRISINLGFQIFLSKAEGIKVQRDIILDK